MNTGWAGKVMIFLTYATQIVILNFLWILGTLAGAIVLGVGPSTRSLGRLATALMQGSPADNPWSEFWSHWRSKFWETNKKGWPFIVLFMLATADLIALEVLSQAGVSNSGLLLGPFIIVAAACAVAYAFFHASLLRFNDGARATMRFSFVAPVGFFPTTIAILLVCLAFVMLGWNWPIITVLCGFSIPLGFSIAMAGRALDRAYEGGFLADDSLLVEGAQEATVRDAKRAEENERMKRMKL